jgi:outer membrane biogenesis lipoprotein LolB
MKRLLLVIAIIGILTSCRSSRTLGKAVAKKDTTTREVVPITAKTDTQQLIQTTLQEVQKNHIDFTTFSAKVSVDYKSGDGKDYDVNASLKMYKDSAIWISVNAILGIEAMRLLVTKDSVRLLVKLDQKTYTARSVSYLQEVTSLPLDLYTLQDLLLGNPVYLDSNIIRYSSSSNVITLVSLGQFFKNLITLNANDKTTIHSKLDDTDPTRSRTADLSYSEYESKKGPLFSTKRQIVVSEKTRVDIKLHFKNYTFNEEVSFPFSVPKNYTRN